MSRWIRRAVVVLLVLVGVALLSGWFALHGSLARLDGAQGLHGLSVPVIVQRDALGVATIDAASDVDAMRALGYVHGQERFFEMDLMRRLAAGELSELFGGRALETDRLHRIDRLRARIAGRIPQVAGANLAQLQAYTDGVNAGLSSLGTRPWPYLLLRKQPRRWSMDDSAMVVFAMYYDLQDASGKQERLRAEVQPFLPPKLYALLMHDGSSWDAPLEGLPRGDAPLPSAADVDLHALARGRGTIGRQAERREVGSNNFAVAGALTSDGRAILANDMHLGLRVPNIWFRARLRYADARAPGGRVDVTGFTLPGVPGVIVGSNTHVAWGYTNSYGDWVDWIRIPDCRPVRCADRRVFEERIAVDGASPDMLRVEESPWGPIESYRPDGSAWARRWVAHQPGAVSFALLDLAHASTIEDALAVADRAGQPAQNMAIASADGRVAWRLIGPVPQRAAGCDAQSVSNARTCPPWPIRSAGAPSIVDPPQGRIWTANARVVDGEHLRRIGDGGYVTAVRARMIRDQLFARPRFTERDLLGIQLDDRSVFLQRWWTLLRSEAARPGAGPSLNALADAAPRLEAHARVGSVGYRLVRGWREAVIARITDGLLAPARSALGEKAEMPSLRQPEGIAWPLVSRQPANLLPARFATWSALFDDAARSVRDDLAAKGPLRERTWGERNTAAICHPLASAIPLGRRLLCMPAEPLDGDTLMPRAVGPDFGASERMVVAPGHEAEGITHMPGGQSGNPLSPFWGAGHDDWVHGRATPFLPGRAVHRLQLTPASR